MRKSRIINLVLLIICFMVFVSFSQIAHASPSQAEYESIVNSTHIYERPYDEGFPTWEIVLNVSGPTPNSTLQDFNISLDFIASGSQEGIQYSNESLTLHINDTVISNSFSSHSNYTGNINDTILLREGDVVNAQFHCNTTKERIMEFCLITLGFSEFRRSRNESVPHDVTIFLECNITMGGDAEGLYTVDSEWYIEYPGSCSGYSQRFYRFVWSVVVLIGIILVGVIVFTVWRSKRNEMEGIKKVWNILLATWIGGLLILAIIFLYIPGSEFESIYIYSLIAWTMFGCIILAAMSRGFLITAGIFWGGLLWFLWGGLLWFLALACTIAVVVIASVITILKLKKKTLW